MRRWLVPAVALFIAVVLGVIDTARDYASTDEFVDHLAPALAKGDLETLRADGYLGFAARVDSEVEQRGTAEYQRIIALYGKRRDLGLEDLEARREQYEKIQDKAATLGADAFDALDESEQWQVWVGKSKADWTYEQALGKLKDKYRGPLPASPAFLADEGARGVLELKLGKPELDEDERALVEQVEKDPKLAEDEFYADVVEKCRRKGQRELRWPEIALKRKLERIERKCDPRPPAHGAKAREKVRAAELGHSALPAQDKEFLANNESDVKSTSAEEQAAIWRLGMAKLDDAERQEMRAIGLPFEVFRDQREEFVAREGDRLYREFLVGTFGECMVTVAESERRGLGGRSLLRSRGAFVELDWSDDGCAAHVGSRFAVGFQDGRWALAFPEEGAEDVAVNQLSDTQ